MVTHVKRGTFSEIAKQETRRVSNKVATTDVVLVTMTTNVPVNASAAYSVDIFAVNSAMLIATKAAHLARVGAQTNASIHAVRNHAPSP